MIKEPTRVYPVIVAMALCGILAACRDREADNGSSEAEAPAAVGVEFPAVTGTYTNPTTQEVAVFEATFAPALTMSPAQGRFLSGDGIPFRATAEVTARDADGEYSVMDRDVNIVVMDSGGNVVYRDAVPLEDLCPS